MSPEQEVAAVPHTPLSQRPLLSRQVVNEHQRFRALQATAELAHEFGVNEVTAVGICRLARMSKGTFYDLFDGLSGCLSYAFREAFICLIGPTKRAQEESGSWLEALARGIGSFYEAAANNPLLAELCLLHSPGAGEEARGNDFEAVVVAIAEVIGDGRGAGPDNPPKPVPLPFGNEEILARGIVMFAALRTRQDNVGALPEHRDEMAMLVVSSLFGADVMAHAKRQLDADCFTDPAPSQRTPH